MKSDFGWAKENARRGQRATRIRSLTLMALVEFEGGLVRAAESSVNFPSFVFLSVSHSCPLCVAANGDELDGCKRCPATTSNAGTCGAASDLRVTYRRRRSWKKPMSREAFLQRMWELVVLTREWIWRNSG